MPLITTEAIILQNRSFSETSKILATFTKERGRISLLVKGGRKGTKKFPGGLETLNRVELQFYHRSGRDLQTFKSFDLIHSYPNLRTDLPRTYTALSLAEPALRCTLPEDSNPGVLAALSDSFEALDQSPLNPWTIRWWGLLGLCRHLGFALNLSGCLRCQAKGPMVRFNVEQGAFICTACQGKAPEKVAGPGEIWGILRFLDTCPPLIATRMVVSPEVGKKIEHLFLQYLKFHVAGLKGFTSWKELPRIYWG